MKDEPLTVERFSREWKHFLSCIDFGKACLDADAIRFMNETPGQIIEALEKTQTQ